MFIDRCLLIVFELLADIGGLTDRMLSNSCVWILCSDRWCLIPFITFVLSQVENEKDGG